MDNKNDNLENNESQTHLYAGGWNTSDKERFSKIIATDLESPKLFLIKAMEFIDADLIKFKIHVDGKTISEPFHEGGNVLVEGKNITIEQLNEGAHTYSTWQVVQEPEIEFDSFAWEVDLSDGIVEPTLVASFTTEREFILDFNITTSDMKDVAIMEVIIDGKSVTRDEPGNPLAMFLEGNSLIGKGKVVAVMIAKSGSNDTKKFSGSIKLRKV